jgi:hypothetical protein
VRIADAEVATGGHLTVHEATEEERQQYWVKLVAMCPTFEDYHGMTCRMEPVSSA